MTIENISSERAGTGGPAAGSDPNLQPGALPFSVALKDVSVEGVPCIESYRIAVVDDCWFVVGGRVAGLHTFATQNTNNFPTSSANDSLWVISPKEGVLARLETAFFDSEDLKRLFLSTNAQSYFDGETMYLVGGYGPTTEAPPFDMGTQDTLAAIPVRKVIEIMRGALSKFEQAARIQSLVRVSHHECFQVTGGELFKLGSTFALVFGQSMNGRYEAFGGDMEQRYTEQVRLFRLDDDLQPIAAGAITNSDPAHPFHRRDGNVFIDVNPLDGQHRIAASGGVFQLGQNAGFHSPVYIEADQLATVDTDFEQRFSAYECPVVVAYSRSQEKTFRTYFGGISNAFYHFTPAQRQMYDQVTGEGRNDSLPFICDITTVVQQADGSSTEWIHDNTLPDEQLLGASTLFIPNPAATAGVLDAYGIVQLDALPAGVSTPVGWIYGGIAADFPFPKIPGSGTHASGQIYEVSITREPTNAIPAGKGTQASSSYPPPPGDG